MEERSYIAFISYRHKPLDKLAAEKIQRKIEHYKVPKEYRAQVGSDRLGMVFRDEDELPASSSLSDSITYALDHAKYLIVICTPDLPKSQWCEQEIRYFLQTHDRDHVLAVLVDGDPQESFSPLLLHEYDDVGNVRAEIEPLAANIAGPNHTIDRKSFDKEIVRLYAAMIGCPFDALWQRERRYRTNRLLAGAGILVAAMAVFLGVVLSKNAQIQQQNDQITEQNWKITSQNLSLEEQKSTLMVDKGRMQLEEDDIHGALQSAIEAAPAEETFPYDHRMQKLLSDSLGAYEYNELHRSEFARSETEIKDMLCTGDVLLAVDIFGKVTCWDVSSGDLLWSSPAATKDLAAFSDAFTARLLATPNGQAALCCTQKDVRAIRLSDGETLWSYERYINAAQVSLSDDGSTLALFDQETDRESPYYLQYLLHFLDTSDGSVIQTVPLEFEGYYTQVSTTGDQWMCGGDFSDDGRYFGFTYYLSASLSSESSDELVNHYIFRVTDLQEKTTAEIGVFRSDMYYTNAVYGLHMDSTGDNLTVAMFSSEYRRVMNIRYSRNLPEGSDPAYWEEHQEPKQVQWYSDVSQPSFAPALFSDRLALTFCDDHYYLSDLEKCELLLSKPMPGKILWAGWADAKRTTLRMITAEGGDWNILFGSPDDQFIILQENYEYWDQSAALNYGVPYGEGRGSLFVLDSSDTGRIMKLTRSTDPSMAWVEGVPDSNTIYHSTLVASPSGNRLFMLREEEDNGGLTLLAYDAATMKLTHTVPFPEALIGTNSEAAAADEEHVWFNHQLLGLDGTTVLSADASEDDLKTYSLGEATLKVHRLSTGDCAVVSYDQVSLNAQSLFANFHALKIWVNGQRTRNTLQVLSTKDLFLLGGNGWVLTHSPKITMDNSTRTWQYDENETAYHAVHVLTGEQKDIPDDCPGSLRRAVAIGDEQPVFAAADTDGCLRLYNIETGEVTLLSDRYDGGSVFSMTFADHDRYLAVACYNGLTDIYDLEVGICCFSETLSLFQYFGDLYGLRAFTDEEQCQLILAAGSSAGYGDMAAIDLDHLTLTARTDRLVCYLPQTHRLLALRGQNLVSYPLHTEADLLTWAREALQEKGE